MGALFKQSRNELAALPAMLGKLLGAIMTVAGFGLAVAISSRHGATTINETLPYLLTGCLGIVVFIISARAVRKRLAISQPVTNTPSTPVSMNLLAWGLLVLFAVLLALFSVFMAR